MLRARAHRLLLACALLAVLLTTAVLAALAAFSASVGDAALRATLRGPAASSAALVVTADVPPEGRAAADAAVLRAAHRTFDGLPVTVRRLTASGPYELPRTLQPAAARFGNPDLTHFAALDPTRIRLTSGTLPSQSRAAPARPAAASGAAAVAPATPGAASGTPATPAAGSATPAAGSAAPTADAATPAAGAAGPAAAPTAGVEVPAALPQAAARRLGIAPGARLRLTDRLTGTPLTVRITGTYQARDTGDPYWQLDPLAGRAVRTGVFTTYGPLLADPALLASGRTSTGTSGWLATADPAALTTGRIDALRAAATGGPEALRAEPGFTAGATVRTALPAVLAQTSRALVVARSTLLIVALQLVLLAGYALLLVARLLADQRSGETGLLRARGASRARVAALATAEALLLAAPAALLAPLLAGPLTHLISGYAGTGDGTGFRTVPPAGVWAVAAAVALCCAAAVVSPALTAAADGTVRLRRGREGALPAPVRAGADLGLVLVAGVAYWQLDRRTGAAGPSAAADSGLGVDPLLVAAPALALLAGTVLTLRLLPPLARLAERRAARSRGLGPALAGWHLSRRPLRGAGPVLLLVLATAMGTLAVGQGASWDRSQRDQADYATGASVRVLDARPGGPGQAGLYAQWPGVRQAAPAHRTTVDLSGGRTATVLALGTDHAAERLLLRRDLADEPATALLRALSPDRPADTEPGAAGSRSGTGSGSGPGPGIHLPGEARALTLDLRLTATPTGGRGTPRTDLPAAPEAQVPPPVLTVLAEDRFGLPYELTAGPVPADGRPRRLTVDLDRTASGAHHAPAGPLRLTGLHLRGTPPATTSEAHRLEITGLHTRAPDGTLRGLTPPAAVRWQGVMTGTRDGEQRPAQRLATTTGLPLVLSYATGTAADPDDAYSVRYRPTHPTPPGPSTPGSTTPGSTTPDPSAPGPAAPGPSTPGPSAPGPAAPGPSTPGSASSGPVPGIATDAFLAAAAARPGDRVDVTLAGERLTVRLVRAVRQLPTTGGPAGDTGTSAAPTGGALLLDLRTANRALTERGSGILAPTEWWLSTRPGEAAGVAAALRARPDAGAADEVLVRDERAAALLDDPLGRGPRAALLAVTVAAAALAAVGFAVSAAGSLREQAAELAVLRALGASRRRLAALSAAEHGLLVLVGVLAGLGIGVLLTRAAVPLLVLTARAERPLPPVLVELPWAHLGLLLAGVAAVPLLTAAALALRHAGPAPSLRDQGDS
ncbi:FtsX-like permease family protein [Streptomyces sp. NPDC101132]|uniref:FtsX-like permease family protein n=1 Tax=Streptomyces sp. NPDC101132 TaxID=3366110 RepID=UPI0037FF3E75